MYDHLGQRLEKVRGTGTTTYASVGYEVAPTGVTKYIYAGGELVATIGGSGATTTTSYIHRDHLSSTNVTTNQSGAVSTVLDYYPYGSLRIETGTPPARQYIGQYDDSESDLAYLNARYYDSGRGQFTSQDPVFWEIGESRDGIVSLYNPQFQNSYSYAANNPIVNKDPDGRFLDTVVDLGFIAYDIYKVGNAIATGGDVRSELGYLALDVAGAATPFATGFGAVARTANVVGNGVQTVTASKKSENIYSVYELYDNSGNVVYTGITKQKMKDRWYQHTQDSRKAGIIEDYKVKASGLSKTQARLVEQAAIEAYGGTGGGKLLNQRNSISPNSKLYKSAESSIKSASKHIANGNYDKAAKDLQKASKQLGKLKK